METLSVACLEMSVRAGHLLEKMQINTIEQFLEIPREAFEKEKGAGKKTVDELTELQSKIRNGEIDPTELKQEENLIPVIGGIPELSEAQLQQLSKVPVTELGLSNRSMNAMKRENIITMDQLIALSDDDFKAIGSLGKKSVDEIKSVRIRWLTDNHFIMDEAGSDDDIPAEKRDFYSKLADILVMFTPCCAGVLYRLCEDKGLCGQIEKADVSYITEDDYRYMIDRIDEIRSGIDRYSNGLFSAEKDCYTDEELAQKVGSDIDTESLKDAVLDYLRHQGNLKKIGDYYVLKREPLEKYIEKISVEERNHLLIDRINGMSLQEIGDKNNITRERVRQITSKLLDKFPLLDEDYYSSVFRFFTIDRDQFCSVFPEENEKTYNYLSLRYAKGNRELTRENLKEYNGLYYEDLVSYLTNDEFSKWKKSLTRQGIAWKVLISHPGVYFDLDSLGRSYDQYLEQIGIERGELAYNNYTINNMLRKSPHVVFNMDGLFRYYENDAFSLWEKIDMGRYSDSVISSELIFKDYSELMEEYDIWNGYELFCLLKNTYSVYHEKHNPAQDILFRRIPVMIIGNGDEEKQLVQFLREIAPIGFSEFYEAYEDRFGVRKDTAAANLCSYLEKYYSEGRYNVDLPDLSVSDEPVIKRLINEKPLWTIKELEAMFTDNCTSSDLNTLNGSTLYNLGYTLNSGYAYSRKYDSMMQCIEDYYFSGDIADISLIDPGIQRLSVFKSYIIQLRSTFNYLEISPKKYASLSFLNREYGLTEDIMKSIQNTAVSYREKYYNANSIWENIKDDPAVRLLKGNKWLCTSILRQKDGVFSFYVVDAVILSDSRDDLSVSQVCAWVAEKEGKMTLEQMTNRINQIFGSGFDKYKIAFKIKEKGIEDQILIDGIDDYLEQFIPTTDVE